MFRKAKKTLLARSQNTQRHSGFSLFEMIVVLVIIAVLIKLYFNAMESPVRDSKTASLEFQANTFSRTVGNLRGIAAGKSANEVDFEGVKIYVNEFGWPANTSSEYSPKSINQTPEECKQLWYAIFQNPSYAYISTEKPSNIKIPSYEISSINKHICRYSLMANQDAPHFFDYDLKTGTVIVSTQ